MKKFWFLLLCFIQPGIFAQINPTQFAKIGYMDPNWVQMEHFYLGVSVDYQGANYYYPSLSVLGLNYVAT